MEVQSLSSTLAIIGSTLAIIDQYLHALIFYNFYPREHEEKASQRSQRKIIYIAAII